MPTYQEHVGQSLGGRTGSYLKLLIRSLQFVLGLTIAGVYGNEIANASKYKVGNNMAWGFATIVGGLTTLTAIIYLLPRVKSYSFWFIDFVYVTFFCVVVGVFGSAYLPKAPPNNTNKSKIIAGPSIPRMKAMVWIDVIDGILWLLTATSSLVLWCRLRSELKKHLALD